MTFLYIFDIVLPFPGIKTTIVSKKQNQISMIVTCNNGKCGGIWCAVSIIGCHHTSIRILIIQIIQFHDNLIFITKFLLVPKTLFILKPMDCCTIQYKMPPFQQTETLSEWSPFHRKKWPVTRQWWCELLKTVTHWQSLMSLETLMWRHSRVFQQTCVQQK